MAGSIHIHRSREVTLAASVLLSGEPNFLDVVWGSFVVSPFFAQPDFAFAPFESTYWLEKRLLTHQGLKVLAPFEHQAGYYNGAWLRMPYARVFDRIPMLETACITIVFAAVFAGLAIIGRFRDPIIEAGAAYAIAMVAVGLLISLATCLSTYFQPRLYLPLYSLFQMNMLLSISLTTNVLLKRLKRSKHPQ